MNGPYPIVPSAFDPVEPDCLLLTRRAGVMRRTTYTVVTTLIALLICAFTMPFLGDSPSQTFAQWLADTDDRGIDIALAEPLPADLVDATRGELGARHVEGERAQEINAALPFSAEAIEAARPFALGAGSLSDQARALHCLTQAVYYEAGFEPVEGRRAVAQVVLNRVRHPAFPNSVCGVVYDGSTRPGCQFSFTCDGSLRRPPAAGAWAAAREIAREALEGRIASTVGTATHYHANYVAPYWAPRLTKLNQIGAHIFYRWPGTWGRAAAFSSRYAGVELMLNPLAAQQDDAVSSASMLPVDPTDRRAPEDVGGRLDVTRGWTLSIPTPAESSGRLAATLGSQGSHEVASPTRGEQEGGAR
jgi:hypothetical protein